MKSALCRKRKETVMKRFLSLLLVLLFTMSMFCLVSCKSNKSDHDDWHNGDDINALIALNIDGESVNTACAFHEDGVELYYNDRLEKELFASFDYGFKNIDPANTALAAAADDVNKDGSSDLVLTIKKEDGNYESIIYYWSSEEKTFKAK